ncbi:MFS transporter [Priestia taiwanensis]|uniref:MFS transporter n=1 Tax=Priestia taiwanensis TaxID=1347902 RepID=A0A917ASI9_9BACI|nr:MFS transporter [Priestia taiwanensis]MBM7363862.1 MFS family permease [Priestia taiwanensis]GGE69588.1 MFS transporter [Priestia taiwanensis]
MKVEVLKNRHFCLFLFSSFLLYLITQFYFLAQVSLVLELTESTILLGTILMVMAIPRLIILPIGGMLTDKFSEKKVLIVGYSALILILAALGVIERLNQLSLTKLFIFAGLFGVSSAIILPATYSIVPKLVSDSNLQSANALVQFLNQLSFFIGPAIAGILLGIVAVDIFFFAMGGVLLAAIFLLSGIKIIDDTNADTKDMNKGMVKGFIDVLKNRVIIMLILFTSILNVGVIGPQQVGLPVFAESYLKLDTTGLSYLLSTFGLGSLMGVLIGGLLPRNKNNFVIMSFIAAVFGVIWGAFIWTNSTWLVFILLCASGLLISIINILFITTLQTSTPKHLLGRVMSLLFMGSTGLQPISYLMTGILIDLIGLQRTYSIAGAIIVVCSCLFMAMSGVEKRRKVGIDIKRYKI